MFQEPHDHFDLRGIQDAMIEEGGIRQDDLYKIIKQRHSEQMNNPVALNININNLLAGAQNYMSNPNESGDRRELKRLNRQNQQNTQQQNNNQGQQPRRNSNNNTNNNSTSNNNNKEGGNHLGNNNNNPKKK
jgi:hypothetical protein